MKKTTEQFIEDARNVHGDKYDYSKSKYVNANTGLIIRCPIHGEFIQKPSTHTNNGSGCPSCSGRPFMDTCSFVKKSQSIHGNRYDYSKTNYLNNKTPVVITCPIHGDFEKTPVSHINKARGCPWCTDGYYERYTKGDWIDRAVEVHGSRYDYSSVDYEGAFGKLRIGCPQHGEFYQNSHDHLMGRGCPSCSGIVSKPEIEISNFIAELGLTVRLNDRSVIPPYEVDIFIPELNLGIEYCGLYWHSTDRGKFRNYHVRKHNMCESKNIRLITIFEDEWLEYPEKVKSTIRHALNKSERGVGARCATIREIPWGVAKPFLNAYHLQNSGSPGTVQYGAYHDDKLIAVAVFGKSSGENSKWQIELKRYVCDGKNHPGLASRMFKHGMRENEWDTIIAYVDRRWFTGDFKYKSGFVIDGIVGPTMHYAKGKKRFNRRFITKRRLVEKTKKYNKTKKQILSDMGYFQIYDAGKLRLIYKR